MKRAVVPACVALGVALLVRSAPVSAVPMQIPYVGQLTFAATGAPFNGNVSVQAALYPTADAVEPLWTGTQVFAVPVIQGVFSMVLGGGDLDTVVLGTSSLWLELHIDGEAMLPRQQVLSVPYALHAGNSAALGGLEADAYLLSGDDIEVGSLTAAGHAWLDGAIRVGSTAEWAVCGAEQAGAIQYQPVAGMLELCDGAAWKPLLDVGSQITTVSWNDLVDIPADFADGVDNDTVIFYEAGVGLLLDDLSFSVDDTVVQRRVLTQCPPGQAMVQIQADGTAICEAVGTDVQLSATGGLAWDGLGELGLLHSCQAGETLAWDGEVWGCVPMATGPTTLDFSQLTGMATDGQIPSDITIDYAANAGAVGGHPYSPAWDSTDAESLGGSPASEYVKFSDLAPLQSQVDAIADGTFVPPSMQQAICDSSLPTKVCKRDVWLAGLPTKDAYSLALLSGGTWVYNEALNRCEYQGGIEHDAPQMCGLDLMPGWMDTTDACGGFRQSTWDSRVRFAVAKDNRWDKSFEYTCPAGYHWATTGEVDWWFNGPNTGVYTYHDQCGWNGYWYKGKRRYYFRFADSAQNQGAHKHSGNYDPYTIQHTNSVDDFAGIVCVQDAPPGPLDWMITEDACGGFKQSEHDPRFWYAVSRKNVFDADYEYQCPAGFRWATTQEGLQAFHTTTNQGTTYHGKCGWSGYDMQANGILRYYFLFNDSYAGPTTQAYKHAGNGEMYKVQVGLGAPTFSYFAGIVCIDESYEEGPTDWMETSDSCGGFRQSTWDPRFSYAIARNTLWDPARTYECPAGYHWASSAEFDAAHIPDNGADQYRYYAQCGWSNYTWKGVTRHNFRFSDSHQNNRYVHAGHYDQHHSTTSATLTEFAGIVCMKDDEPAYPNPGTTDWMLTDDHCRGFRESTWNANVRYAVSRQNVWDPNAIYTCPDDYHWATAAEYEALHSGPNTSYYKYNAQCGWSGYTWQNRYRLYFRFADSHINNKYAHAAHGDPATTAVAAATTSFAGVVCIRDTPDPDPTAWMLKSDNCGGFRQSPWDERHYFAVSRTTTWDPNQVYTCPDGYEWITTNQALEVWPTVAPNPNQGASYVYYGRCGWLEYNWQQQARYFFRFSDSHLTGAAKHAGHLDPYQVIYNATTANFAGIVCRRIEAPAPTAWMETTDNCSGFRQSMSSPDVYYAVSTSDVWDRNRTYQCPAGYHWASTQEAIDRFTGTPAYDSTVYHNQCGWSGYNWNPAWPLGCASYGTAGCGSSYNSPQPTMYDVKNDPSGERYAKGCDECSSFYATACTPPASPTNGGAGACSGITEGRWYHDQHLTQCYRSPASFSGFPSGLKSGQLTDHCKGGVCCGSNELENLTRYRVYFRFSDSASTNAYKHSGNHENHAVQYDGATSSFAGIVCIQD